jgi:hypothetical protein
VDTCGLALGFQTGIKKRSVHVRLGHKAQQGLRPCLILK